MRRLRRSSFTLIELVAAIAIIAVATGIATATFRGESPARKLENTSLEFEAFCARVRFRACESGEPWVVNFAPGSGEFTGQSAAAAVAAAAEAQTAVAEAPAEGTVRAKEIKFKLPANVRFHTADFAEDQMFDHETLEVFRFFSDGAAAGKYKLVLHCGELKRSFEVSQLTGALLSKDQTGDEP